MSRYAFSDEEALLRELQRELYAQYDRGKYAEALRIAEEVYTIDAARTDNLLLLGAINFQLRNFSEAIFYNQQAIRIEPQMAEAYSNLANALKELGDVRGAMQFYLKAIKHKPRFGDAYNNLASAHMHLGQINDAIETYQMGIVIDPGLVDAHCNLGNLFKAQGKLEAARKCYLEAIRLNPEFAIAWSNLAGLFKDEGQLSTAVAYYREAIRLCPPFADVYSNLGSAMQDQGNLVEAKQCYQTAIRLRPDFAIAHGNLGSCLLVSGDAEGAVRALRRAIQLEPNFPDAYNNLGNALRSLAQPLLPLYLSSDPSDDPLITARDGIYVNEAKREAHAREAITCYRTALRLKPDHPHAYSNLGNAMRDRGLVREAIHCNVTAARLMPRFAPAHANLGSLLREQGQLDQALAHYHQAIALDPDYAEAYTNLGNAYRELCQPMPVHGDGGNYEDAIVCYERALALKPHFPDAFAGLLQAKDSVCDWTARDVCLQRLAVVLEAQLASDGYDDAPLDGAKRLPSSNSDIMSLGGEDAGTWRLVTPSTTPAFHGCLPCIQPLDALALTTIIAPRDAQRLARRYAARARANLALSTFGPFHHHHVSSSTTSGREKSRIHIGYLSANFGNRPVGHLLALLLKHHERSRFFVTCYSLAPSDGSTWHAHFEDDIEGGVKDIGLLSSGDAARLINADGVHILAHLDGHTANARNDILALRPAPIQIAFVLGFSGTFGADYMDYLVADRIVLGPQKPVDAPGTPYDIDERALILPNSCILNGHAIEFHTLLDDPEAQPTRETYGLPEDAFVFAYFGQLNKMDSIAFGVWMNILKRVPNSLLWLHKSPESAVDRLKKRARDHQVHEQRLFFTYPVPKRDSIYRSLLADLVLDTPACNATDATLDSLWAGTPVVALLGNTIATRISASLCSASGCPELVTTTLGDYEDLAVSLAVDADKYWGFRQKLEEGRRGVKQSPLFDCKQTLSYLEAGYEAVWARVVNHQPPADILMSSDMLMSNVPRSY